jgi:ElaA protein
MDIKFEIKRFKELSAYEIYAILRLRSEIFIIEQNCVYQDIDNKDQKAFHVIGRLDDTIVAYARLFNAGDYFVNASIGRVVIDQKYRNQKWGHLLLKTAINGIAHHFDTTKIIISAQLYLKKFYESNGFVQTSEMYLEDDIPHIEMKKQ